MNNDTNHDETISPARTTAGWHSQRQTSHHAPATRQRTPSAPHPDEDRAVAPALQGRWPLTATETLLVFVFAGWLFAALAWLRAHA